MARASTARLGSRLLRSHAWEGVRARAPHRVARLLEGLVLASDPASVRRWLSARPVGEERLVELRLRPLGGRRFAIRSGTADVWALPDTFLPAEHLPPPELAADSIRTIWDLGANIGASMAHLATLHPRAQVVGVELDAANADLCRRNVAPYGSRCELVAGAVWTHDGRVAYRREGLDALSFRIEEGAAPADGEGALAVSLDTLLARHGDDAVVDYVKMDIEGAERQVLRERTDWAGRVRSIKVEVHEPYTTAECVADLERLGFRAWPEPGYRGHAGKPPVVGVR